MCGVDSFGRDVSILFLLLLDNTYFPGFSPFTDIVLFISKLFLFFFIAYGTDHRHMRSVTKK